MEKETKPSVPAAYVADDPAKLLQRRNCSYWEWFTKWFAVVMLAVFPLTIGFNGYYDITESKYIIFKIFVSVYLAGIALIWVGFLLQKSLLRQRGEEGWQRLSLPQILLLAFAAWSILSALLSQYRSVTWVGDGRFEGVCSLLFYTVVFMCFSFWGEYSDKPFYAMGAMAVVLGLVSILQTVGVDFLSPEGMDYSTIHFLATIGNVDCVGGIISIIMPALGCMFVLRESKWRWYVCLPGYLLLWYVQLYIDVDSSKLGLGFALLVALPFLLTQRRHAVNTLVLLGATAGVYALQKLVTVTGVDMVYSVTLTPGKRVWVLLAAALVLLGLAYLLSRSDKPLRFSPKTMRLATAGVLLVCVAAGLVLLYTYGGSNRLLGEISQAMHGNLTDDAGSGRGIVWKNCIKLIAANPVTGYGPGTFMTVYEPYNTTIVFDFAHNDFLQIGVCQGLVGLVLYMAFLIALAVRAFKWAPRCPMVVIMASSVAGYLVHSFFAFSIAIVMPLFWVMAGLLDKCIRQIPRTAPAEGKRKDEKASAAAKPKAVSGGKTKKAGK